MLHHTGGVTNKKIQGSTNAINISDVQDKIGNPGGPTAPNYVYRTFGVLILYYKVKTHFLYLILNF